MYHQVKYQTTGSYVTSQPITGLEKELWIVLHGYGQLANFFLNKFSSHFNSDRLFIAPEATNYSYLKKFSGRVGANWMTKHQRELAIANNHHFLNAILNQSLSYFSTLPSINILGFSQGSATATRWAAQLEVQVNTLVLWGGGFAHDIDLNHLDQSLKNTRTFMVLGDQDPFLTEEKMKEQEEILQKIPIQKEKISYQGGHDIYPETLKEIFEKVNESYSNG
ncbi:alpha/beta hydrolase [Echinicola sp. 20G]|uniref:alpha/beta hydrolase n=1 Tax=Echinicola sp. 20G TaxID=2781961 RepID=UPI00190FD838|nr:alpha/beta hydrolase [Echinicola sp. 20G]